MEEYEKLIDLDPFTVVKWRMTEICNMTCPFCLRGNNGIDSNKKRLLSEAYFISHIKTDRPVKVELIGGEVTTIPFLEEIYDILKSKAARIQITTNTSKDSDYYNHLNKIIETTYTFSFHEKTKENPNGLTLDQYMNIVSKIQSPFFTLEMVSTNNNQEIVKEFIEKTKEYPNVMVDVDRSAISPFMDKSETNLLHLARKESKNYRYKLIDLDKKEHFYYSKPELLVDYGNGKFIKTQDKLCDKTHYVYIENHTVALQSPLPEECGKFVDIDSVKNINEALKKKVCKLYGCTLCGHQSIL